jgi:hypothetical protein
MRRVLLSTGVALAVVLATAAVGGASSGTVTDPSGDLYDQPTTGSSASYDLVRATFGHSRGRIVHTVTTAGNVPDPASGGAPMIHIVDPVDPNGTSECRYFIGRFDGRFGVFKCGYGTRVGSLRMTRTGARTVRFEFSPKAIGNPASYEWAVRTRTRTRYNVAYWVDRLPDGDRTNLTHQLR